MGPSRQRRSRYLRGKGEGEERTGGEGEAGQRGVTEGCDRGEGRV